MNDHQRSLPFEIKPEHERAGRAFAELVALQGRLRSPGGCAWDAEQTHHSLARHLLEEAYETVDSILDLPDDAPGGPVAPDLTVYDSLREELGDVLMQVVFHACLAQEADAFDAQQVTEGIVDKLVERHPHVFGEAAVRDGVTETDTDQLVSVWERAKLAQKQRESVLDDIPASLPALLRITKLFRRTQAVGFDWEATNRDARAVINAALEGSPELPEAEAESQFGQALMALAFLVRARGVDPETAVAKALKQWERDFRASEPSVILSPGVSQGVRIHPGAKPQVDP